MTLPLLFQSKRFVTLILTIIVEIGIALVPELEANRAALMEIVAIIAGAVILTFGAQDTAAAYRGTATKYFKPVTPVG